jgi:hypothetical protein
MKINKQLAKFLANEGVLTRFINNHIAQHGEDYPITICHIRFAFRSNLTPEGSDFWLELNRKWKWKSTPEGTDFSDN